MSVDDGPSILLPLHRTSLDGGPLEFVPAGEDGLDPDFADGEGHDMDLDVDY
jgi:hypothetical protein